MAVASAAASNTSTVFGIALANIANNGIGQVRISGEYSPIDTSAFVLNSYVYLSDIPGTISSTPGTVNSIIGYALTIGISGSISVTCIPSGSTGALGGSGLQGSTGLQ